MELIPVVADTVELLARIFGESRSGVEQPISSAGDTEINKKSKSYSKNRVKSE